MRFHLPALVNQPTTEANSHCAYTQKVVKFSKMMVERGHEVYIYGDPTNDAICTEHIPCYPTSEEIVPFEPNNEFWVKANKAAETQISLRQLPGDFLCVIAGLCQQPLSLALPELMTVEFGVGYGGVFADYKVFESYAWMHTVYGATMGSHEADGVFFDEVIPNYFDVSQFPEGDGGGDYLLYVGRMIERKGVYVASQIAEKLDCELLMAGEGEHIPSYGAYLGSVGPKDRGVLMAKAKALLAPTLYLEPFGGVTIEAMMCGTPVLTTDWGAFTETVIPGFNGYRCKMFRDFCNNVELASKLDRKAIRNHAISNYSLEAVAPRYEEYFQRLTTLYADGWYAT